MAENASKPPGVIASIREFLSEATEESPITKGAILEKLQARFPERDPKSMKSTVDQQVPNKLRAAGFRVKKTKLGYYLPSEDGLSSMGSSLAPSELHSPQTIRIDAEVYRALQKIAVPFVETPNDVLRRLLGLPPI